MEIDYVTRVGVENETKFRQPYAVICKEFAGRKSGRFLTFMGDFDRVRWRCRRGLLELDLILSGFLDTRYARLDAEQRRLFDELLEEADNDLLDLAMGRREPEARHRAMVEMLRAA